MAENTWVHQVRDPADASTKRTTGALVGRTDYLKRRIDAAEFGQAVFAHDVTIDPDLLEGQPVFWNDNTQRFEAALAAVESDSESSSLVTAPSADCLGVLYTKEFANKGSILLFGYAPLDVTHCIGADAPAGRYYLSASEAGKLVKQRPAVSVPVLYYDGVGNVFVQPTMKDFVEDHIHFSFDLVCEPAGIANQPAPGERHIIQTIDVTKRGWLPASVFGSRAPRRAVFGYNLAAHPQLQRVWPPIPITAVELMWDKGNNSVGGTRVPLGPDGLVVIDHNGIWWMSDCYGDVPWPTNTGASLSSYPSSAALECSRSEKMRLTLSFARMAFATNKTVVTSLQPAEGSPIRFSDCNGKEANTGDLFARFVTDFLISDNDTDGNLAFKDLDGNKFKRGYVVQGVLSGNDNLTITGTRTKKIGGKTYHQGLLEFSVNLDPAARDLPVQLVRLDDVKERHYQDVMYLGFPAGQESKIRGKVKVPGAGLPASPKVKFRFQILGRSTGTLPDLTLSYRILPRPSTATAVALPTTDTLLAFAPSRSITADRYVEVESASFNVAAGDTVLFTLLRSSDSYAGEVGVLDVVGVLFAGG